MSSGGRSHTAPAPSERAPVNLPRLAEMKLAGEPIVMVTAYDYPSAMVAEEAGVDMVLVGDSAAMVVLGYPGTEAVTMEEMVVLGKAVRRGLKTPLMVGDLPMGSYESSNELAVQSAQRLVKETGCQTVKLEAGGIAVERARAIVRSGIPVMGHIGLTPQTATALGGYKAQGKTAKDAMQLCEDALALQAVGCFAIVIEAVPAAITEAILGPALARLSATFPARSAYCDFWRVHPAFVGKWTPAVEAYVDYDLTGSEPYLRSRVSAEAVSADSRDQLVGATFQEAGAAVGGAPLRLLRAPLGLQNEPPGLYPEPALEAATSRLPGLVWETVPDVNHYTVLLSDHGARAVGAAIREAVHSSESGTGQAVGTVLD